VALDYQRRFQEPLRLEWVTYLFLSQDPIGIEEWYAVVEDPKKNDMHTANQLAFKLPSRLIAKVFLFRWIYRGPAFAYANDPDFTPVSKKVDFWQEVIDRYYAKYKALHKTHMNYIKQVNMTGTLTSPLGRTYEFKRYFKRGGHEYSEYEITNYPNQGLGADVCAVARVALYSRIRRDNLRAKFISTIHDSISLDCPVEEKDRVIEHINYVFKHLPHYITRAYGIEWNLPLVGEISVGPNMSDLEEIVIG
jgi:DNA polymerase I-like protein with 3'-5' exonuclease and polymerase domains